jgi:hypothetical protein
VFGPANLAKCLRNLAARTPESLDLHDAPRAEHDYWPRRENVALGSKNLWALDSDFGLDRPALNPRIDGSISGDL